MKKNNLKSVMKSIFMITLMFSLMIQTALAGKFIVNTEEFGEVVVEVRERNLFDNLFAVTLNPNTASPGETVTLTWTGDIDYAEQGIAVVQLQINSNYYDITAQSGLDCTGCSAQFSVNFQAPNSPGTYTVQIVIYDYGNQPLTTGAGDTQTLTVENPDQCSSDSDCPSSEFCWFDANPNICWPDYETGNTVQCDRNAQCVSGLCSDNNGALTHPMCIDPVADTCDDSDGGKEYNVPGVAVSSINGQLADSCTSGTQLQEVFCDTDLRWDIEYYTCPDVCNPAGYCDTSTCSPVWNCGAWSACTNDVQTRTCTDSNNCPGETPPTSMTEQSCDSSCTETVSCTAAQCGSIIDGDCSSITCPACNPTCTDGEQNGDETGVDCGGSCSACSSSGKQWNDFSVKNLDFYLDGADGAAQEGETIVWQQYYTPATSSYDGVFDPYQDDSKPNNVYVNFDIENNMDIMGSVEWEVAIYPKQRVDENPAAFGLQSTFIEGNALRGDVTIADTNCGKKYTECGADSNCETAFVSSGNLINIAANSGDRIPEMPSGDMLKLDIPGAASVYNGAETVGGDKSAFSKTGEYYVVVELYDHCYSADNPSFRYDRVVKKFNVKYPESNGTTIDPTGTGYKTTVEYKDVEKLTTYEKLASSCVHDAECEGYTDKDRDVDCIPIKTLVEKDHISEAEKDDFIDKGKFLAGGIGVYTGALACGASIAILFGTAGLSAPITLAICGGAAVAGGVGGLYVDEWIDGWGKDDPLENMGLCIDESKGSGGSLDEFLQGIADDYFDGDKQMATVVMIVVFFFAMIIFTRV